MREKLADYAHETWCGWMRYMFSKSLPNEDGSFTISPELYQRWRRQMKTKYKNLPENEKESDRKEAKLILDIINEY